MVGSIIKIGYKDYQRGVYFLDNMVSISYERDIKKYKDLYKFGQEYGKKGYNEVLLNLLATIP